MFGHLSEYDYMRGSNMYNPHAGLNGMLGAREAKNIYLKLTIYDNFMSGVYI